MNYHCIKNKILVFPLYNHNNDSEDYYLFCDELLEKYEFKKEVMMISGDNFQSDTIDKNSYYFKLLL